MFLFIFVEDSVDYDSDPRLRVVVAYNEDYARQHMVYTDHPKAKKFDKYIKQNYRMWNLVKSVSVSDLENIGVVW